MEERIDFESLESELERVGELIESGSIDQVTQILTPVVKNPKIVNGENSWQIFSLIGLLIRQNPAQAAGILTLIARDPKIVNGENGWQIFSLIGLFIEQNPAQAAEILTTMAQPENLNKLSPIVQINLVNNLIRLAGATQGEEQQYLAQAAEILTLIARDSEIVNENDWRILNSIGLLIRQNPEQVAKILTLMVQNPKIVNRNNCQMFDLINLLIRQNPEQVAKILTLMAQPENLSKLSPEAQIDLANSLIRLAGVTQGEKQQQYLNQATGILTLIIVQNPEMVNENDYQIFNSINLLIGQNPAQAAGILTLMAQPENLSKLSPEAQIDLANSLIRLAGVTHSQEHFNLARVVLSQIPQGYYDEYTERLYTELAIAESEINAQYDIDQVSNIINRISGNKKNFEQKLQTKEGQKEIIKALIPLFHIYVFYDDLNKQETTELEQADMLLGEFFLTGDMLKLCELYFLSKQSSIVKEFITGDVCDIIKNMSSYAVAVDMISKSALGEQRNLSKLFMDTVEADFTNLPPEVIKTVELNNQLKQQAQNQPRALCYNPDTVGMFKLQELTRGLTGANQDFEQRIDMKKQQKSSQQGI